MKKLALLLILASLALSLVASTTHKDINVYKPIQLQAAYGKVSNISVTRIPAQSTEYMTGMPFNIEDKFVQYRETENGREIAKWSILSNTNYKLRIDAEELHHITDVNPEMLSYILVFTYQMGYVDAGGNRVEFGNNQFALRNGDNPTTQNGTIVNDGTGNKFEFYIVPTDLAGNDYSGSVEGSIFFMFTEESTNTIEADKNVTDPSLQILPAGNYTAHVKIEMIAEGE